MSGSRDTGDLVVNNFSEYRDTGYRYTDIFQKIAQSYYIFRKHANILHKKCDIFCDFIRFREVARGFMRILIGK